MADEKFKRAIFEALTREYDSMIPQASEHTFSPGFERKMQKLISRREKPYYIVINTVGKRAACIILAAIIVFTMTVMNVEALRNAFRDFFVNIFEKFSIVQSADKDNVPETIEDIYEITYDLCGFTKEVWVDTDLDRRTRYIKDGYCVRFNQAVKSFFDERINTEDAAISTITINGHEAMYYCDNHNYDTIIWDNGDYIFTLSANIGKDKLIEIAKTVQKVE